MLNNETRQQNNKDTNLKYDDDLGSLLYKKVIVFIEYQQLLPHR